MWSFCTFALLQFSFYTLFFYICSSQFFSVYLITLKKGGVLSPKTHWLDILVVTVNKHLLIYHQTYIPLDTGRSYLSFFLVYMCERLQGWIKKAATHTLKKVHCNYPTLGTTYWRNSLHPPIFITHPQLVTELVSPPRYTAHIRYFCLR